MPLQLRSLDTFRVPHWYMYPPKSTYTGSLHIDVVHAEIEKLSRASVSLYVHVPFCGMKCSFCSLFTSPGMTSSTFPSYTGSLKREIADFSERLGGARVAVPIMYFGGGTPALLPEEHLACIIEQIHRHFDTTHLQHCSVEFSPDVVDAATAARWRRYGFNRASLGVQSFDDAALKSMHRAHSGDDALAAVQRLADAGYDDINVDLIFGHVKQTTEQWDADLQAVLASGATHCTFHPLATQPKTTFERKAIARDGASDATRELHASAIEFFTQAGWRQSSTLSFSRSTSSNPLEVAESKGQITVGFGPGSRSYYPSIHTSTVPYTERTGFSAVMRHYHDSVAEGRLPIMNTALLDQEEQQRRALILQMHHGFISKQIVRALESEGGSPRLSETLARMEALDWIIAAEDGFVLTKEGSVSAAQIGLAFASTSVRSSLTERTL